jgi:hypothetical protein
MRVFTVFCLKNTLRDKVFLVAGAIKINATQQLKMHQADYWRCFLQRKNLWNKLIQGEVYWFRRDQYVMTVTSGMLVPQRQSGCFLIRHRGGTSGFVTLHTEWLCSPH